MQISEFLFQCRLVKSVGVLGTNFGIDNFGKKNST